MVAGAPPIRVAGSGIDGQGLRVGRWIAYIAGKQHSHWLRQLNWVSDRYRLQDVAIGGARYKYLVHELGERPRWWYWTIRAWVEGWVLLFVRRGPRAFWARLTHAPYRSTLRFGFSTIAQGYNAGPDVAVVLTPPGPPEPDPGIISPRRVRDFVRAVVPGATSEPRLDALVALEEEHGHSGLTGDPVRDAMGARAGGPYLSVDATGRLSLRTRSIHRPSFEDTHRFYVGRFSDPEPRFLDDDPLYDTDPLFDVVDVLLPLYLAATAVSNGAYDRLLQRRSNRQRRHHWLFDIEERIAFPAPRGGPSPVGFPGRIPARIALVGPRPEPSTARVIGRSLTRRNCRPELLVGSVLVELLAHWGYECDPVVVAEVMAALESQRVGTLVEDRR
jgi:hypothetical protein